MVNYLIGAMLGFLAGMGVGGGSLLMIYLTAVLNLPMEQARGLNLLFFIPCALTASLFRLKEKTLPLKKLWLPMVFGACSAMIFSGLSGHLDEALLKKGFGILLLLTAWRELRYRPRNAK